VGDVSSRAVDAASTAASAPLARPAPAKLADEIFCQSCGAVIKREAEICANCGVRVRGARTGSGGKSKVAAIVLAVFLSGWSWLYTYREDGWKFWFTLGVTIANFILTVVTVFWIIVWIFVGLGFYIWAIVDAAVKSDDWYADYDRR
jgi:hypothetical protein